VAIIFSTGLQKNEVQDEIVENRFNYMDRIWHLWTNFDLFFSQGAKQAHKSH
jgi:hypothetical protein